MPNGPPPSRPPSDPRPLPSRAGADWGGPPSPYDPPVRLQMMAAVILAIVLIAVPLYLWRRPRAVTDAVAGDGGTQEAAVAESPYVSQEIDAESAQSLRLGDARVIECRDPGSKKVPSEHCDALPTFAKGFADAILAAKDCIPRSAGAGSITYVADVGFSRRRVPIKLALPKDGRSYRSAKVVGGCAAAVRAGVTGIPIDAIPHSHVNYKIAVVATYPAPDAGAIGDN